MSEICYNIQDKNTKINLVQKIIKKKGNKNEKRIKKNKINNKSQYFLNCCFIFIYFINKEKCSLFFLYARKVTMI